MGGSGGLWPPGNRKRKFEKYEQAELGQGTNEGAAVQYARYMISDLVDCAGADA